MQDAWAEFEDAPKRRRVRRDADQWAEFEDHRPAARQRARPATSGAPSPTGQAHDGDTFALSDGRNARLYGVDAFELQQEGRSPTGVPVPLGARARDALIPYAQPDGVVTPTGTASYGRPFVSLTEGGRDAGDGILRDGLGLAAPEYLRADPQRLHDYMEAERFARQNRHGAHATTYASPDAYRHGNGSPWAEPQPAKPGEPAEAVFWDEPTPFQGLRPEIERGYLAIWQDLNSKPEDLINFARANGFTIDPDQTRKRYSDRNRTRKPGGQVAYATPPRVLTDPGDGAVGAAARGLADPINMLDEMGGVVDALGGTGGRENVWNSDRRFGDILWNNIDQNRSILGHDDAEHPYARFGGQLASGLVLPGASIEGVGLRAATQVLRQGGTRIAAEAAAEAAVRNRLIAAGAAEGGLAGAGGADDGGVGERVKGGVIGAVAGGTLGGLTAVGGQAASNLIASRLSGRLSARVSRDAGDDAAGVNATPEPQPRDDWADFPDAAMASEIETPQLVGPRLEDTPRTGTARPLLQDAPTPERLAVAETVHPNDVLPAKPRSPEDGPTIAPAQGWGDAAPDFAGNIRLENLDSPQDISRALTTSVQRVGGFDAATRGRISNEETANLAADLGLTADDLLARRKGQAFNAEQALAARQILARSGNELVNLARRVKDVEDPGDELLATFRRAWVRHVAIQEQVSGMTAEAGRTLQQFRMMADSRLAPGRVLAAAVDGAGGPDRLKEAADVILDSADDPALLNAVSARAMKPAFKDKLVELWYNSLLSGPQTHAVNVMSNTITSIGQLPEHLVAATLGAPRARGRRGTDRVLFSEVGARSVGLLNGTIEGLRQAARTIRTGETSDAVTKVEAQNQHAISGVKGSIIRTPTRALAAEDELFKAIARRMELHGLAVRQAAAEGLRGDAASRRAADLIANPTDDMIQRAFEYGRYITFQRPLGPVGQSVTRITGDMPILKLVLPFVRTPTNLLKFTLERSPAAPLLKEWRADFKAGGARRDLAVAKAMVGSGVGALVAKLAGEGMITGGGPADEDARALLQADGWQPYSVRLGDRYYSYQRLDPLASTLGIAADLVDLQSHMTDKQQEQVATLVGIATIQNLSSKTWLSGMTDLVEAINDPDRNLRSFLARTAGSLAVPTGVAQVARVTDPVLREAREPLDRIRSRIPGASRSLPPRRDVLGREMQYQGGLGPDIVSPIWTSTRQNNPAINALIEAGIGVNRPQRFVDDPTNSGRRRIELTPEQYDSYQQLTGEIARPQIDALTQGKQWKGMSLSDREESVRKIMTRARREARGTLMLGEGPRPAPKAPPPGVAGLPDPWLEFRDAR